MKYYIVLCCVSGGVTGTRESLLKGKDGKCQHFETLEQARAEAARLSAITNGNPYRTADFRYWVEEE